MGCNCGGGAKSGMGYKITEKGVLIGYALTIGETRVMRGVNPTIVVQQVPIKEAEEWLAARQDAA